MFGHVDPKVMYDDNDFSCYLDSLSAKLITASNFLCVFYSNLPETLQKMDLSCLQPFPPAQPKKFADFLDQCMGFG